MAAPVQVDSNTGFAAGGVQTLSATIDWTPTSGNLLLYACGGDKNLGTFTMTDWTVPVDLRSSSVSLIMAYKVSDGTETVASGTCTGANSGGSNTWVAEYSQTGSGAWGLRATKGENNSDENNQTVWSSGTTGTTDLEGKAIAAWATDSVVGAGTPTYTNGFSQIRVTSTGSGQAGLWVASADASAAATYESTIDRVGGTADQMSGAILVVGRGAAGTTLEPGGIAGDEGFGTSAVSQAVSGTGVASDEAFGSVVVARGQGVSLTGIASEEALGSVAVLNPQTLTLTAIDGAEAFGDATLTIDGSGAVIATAVDSAEAFGSHTLTRSPFTVQADNHFIPGGTFTFDAPLPISPADAGNAIFLAIVGDKNIGTLTLDGVGWNVPVNLRSTSLSLVIAWKEAAGGELGATGSFTTGNPGGSQVYISELETSDPGVWALKASASNNTNETNVTSVSTGTTGAAVGNGKAMAVFGVDSFKSDTTDAFSNDFTTLFAQSTGDAETGMWVAQKGAVAGETYESTLTRTQLVATLVPDQMSGAVVVLGKAFVQDLAPVGIEPGEAFGSAVVPGPLQPTGIVSSEAFGELLVEVGDLLVVPTGIDTSEAIGEPVLSFGFVIQATSAESGETFGVAVVEIGARKFYLGATQVEGVLVGETTVTAGYVGSALVW